MKKLYIAGKMSGEVETPELMKKCWSKFDNYGFLFLDQNTEFTHGFIINSKLIASGKGTWQQYMKNDIATMLTCDEIHMLPDWKDSRGAKIEHQLALDLNIKIVYANYPDGSKVDENLNQLELIDKYKIDVRP